MNAEPHEKDAPSPEILARRTEKAWRHEDRALTGTHVLWGTTISAHTVIVSAAGLFIGISDQRGLVLFPWIFGVSCGAMAGIILLAFLLLRYDRTSARYFLLISQPSSLPSGFDKTKGEAKRQEAEICYRWTRRVIEPAEVVLLAANLIMFYLIVMSHKHPS